MKKYLFFTFLYTLLIGYLYSQAPQSFKYQAIARDEIRNIITNQVITVRVSMIQENKDADEVFIEIQQVKSDPYGMINLLIGKGEVIKGRFSDIKWGEESYTIKIEMDINGGNDFKILGTSEFYSVPFALYAEQTGKVIGQKGELPDSFQGIKALPKKTQGSRVNGTPNSKIPANDDSFLNVNTGNVGIGTSYTQETLYVMGKIMASEGFNSNGVNGHTDTLNIIIENDYVIEKLKYRSYTFKSGIVSYISNESAWVDSVGGYLLPWECGDSLFDSRDSTYYQTVLISEQCWMAENINIGTRIDGVSDQLDNTIIEKYCYNDSEDYCSIYGGLYLWDEMMQYVSDTVTQGICPPTGGWHIPTDNEWKILEGTVDSEYSVGDPEWDNIGFRGLNAGKYLKSTTGWNNGNGLDYYGFTALPGGFCSGGGGFYNIGGWAYFWSSSGDSSPHSWGRSMHFNNNEIERSNYCKPQGFSVRCLKD